MKLANPHEMSWSSERKALVMLSKLGFNLRRPIPRLEHCDFYGKDPTGRDTIVEVKDTGELRYNQKTEMLTAARNGSSVYLVVHRPGLCLFKMVLPTWESPSLPNWLWT